MNLLKSYNYIKDNLNLINSINVFPVFDKDTGNNVLYTLESIKDVEVTKESISIIAEKSIYSARGNSGNILSLFLIGLSQNKDKNLHDMCKNAAEFTWNNMYNPQHGTILDALNNVPENSDIENFLLNYYNNSLNELMTGKNKLKILEDYDTVDAGTLCLVYLLKGLYESLSNKVLDLSIELAQIKNKLDNDKYKFCINFTIDSTQCDIPENVEFDNFIKVSTGTVSRIHIHSNEYESVLDFYRNYGNISNLYIQDMDSTV